MDPLAPDPPRRGRASSTLPGALVDAIATAPTRAVAAELKRPPQTARRLVEASVNENTRRAYFGALRRLDAWLDGRMLEDVTLAELPRELHDQGRAPGERASTAVAAARFRARLAGEPSPAGERTARVLAGYRRTAGDRRSALSRPPSRPDDGPTATGERCPNERGVGAGGRVLPSPKVAGSSMPPVPRGARASTSYRGVKN